ncbi:hypothetical protein GQ457_12G001510 [Hibiscus cannabinus]
MEKHKSKLCASTFSNDKALGGHMKGHLANHLLPPKQPITTSNSVTVPTLLLLHLQRKVREKQGDSGIRQAFGLWVERESQEGRSKRKPKVGTASNATTDEIKEVKISSSPSLIDSSPTEPKPVSSVSDTFPDEDVEGEEMF